MNENVPFIWRKNYRNETASPEKLLEIAHEKAPPIFEPRRRGCDEINEVARTRAKPKLWKDVPSQIISEGVSYDR